MNNLTEEEFLKLDEDKMLKLGLKYGQRKKLVKYIEYFNYLKEDDLNEDIEITISETSSDDDMKEFLRTKLKLSQQLIDKMDLDSESLFLLEEKDIDDFEMTEQEKKMIKNLF